MKLTTLFKIATLSSSFFLSYFSPGQSQEIKRDNFYIGHGHLRSGVPYFSIKMYNFADRGVDAQTMVLVRTQIGYGDLQFVKIRDDLFEGTYEVEVKFLDSNKESVAAIKWENVVGVPNYYETKNLARYDISEKYFRLAPGRYTFTADLLDHETGKRGEIEGFLEVKDFSGTGLMASDIVFQDSLQATRSRQSSAKIEDDSGSLFATLEVYNVAEGDTISIACEVLNQDEIAFLGGTVQAISRGPRTRIGVEMGKTNLSSKTPPLRLKIRTATDTLNIALADPYAAGRVKLFEDVDEALKQLAYVATAEELDLLKNVEPHDRTTAFYEFWEGKDPTPETKDNELMINFYVRVDFANRTFAGARPGWQTEMGEVYIKLGRPDAMMKGTNNERFADLMSMNEPTVIWHYENYRVYVIFNYLAGEYHIANYGDVQYLLNDGVIF